MGKSSGSFRFKKNDTVGAPAAEDDHEYLQTCFVDTGDYSLLADTSDRRIVILGRTGTGKSALVSHLADTHLDRVIIIKPENLALTYIANSTILRFIADLGINLDPFYKLLWRHVFTVEILTRFFDQHMHAQSDSLFDRLRNIFSGPSREDKEIKQAIDYLEEWGKEFWNETEYRVKEITQKVEKDLESAVNAMLGTGWLKASAKQTKAARLSEEKKIDITRRAQEIVSQTQVKDLHQVSKILEKVLTDKQKSYYIVIDALDENWVEETQRYKLIKGLLLTAREFIKIPNVKILIALRRDLIDRMFRLTRDSGFQEEKYQGLYIPLVWTKRDILDILDRRVRQLVHRRYTKQTVTYTDLLPSMHKGIPINEFIFSIANRPRDVIALFNTCIHAAIEKSRLTTREFTKAIGEYSRSRLRALADEWNGDYPHLLDFANVLGGRPSSFKVQTIGHNDIEELCLSMVTKYPGGNGLLMDSASSTVNDIGSPDDFRLDLLQAFYHVGLIGLKTSADMSASWVDDTGQSVSRGQIDENTSVIVAKKYAYALGVRV